MKRVQITSRAKHFMLQDFQSMFKTSHETGSTTAAAAPTVTATNKLSFLLNRTNKNAKNTTNVQQKPPKESEKVPFVFDVITEYLNVLLMIIIFIKRFFCWIDSSINRLFLIIINQ